MKKLKRKKFTPQITKIKLNYEQALLSCDKVGMGPAIS